MVKKIQPHAVRDDETFDFLEINLSGRLRLAEMAAPGTPPSGYGYLYPKTDGKIYWKDDAGAEFDLTQSGGGIGWIPIYDDGVFVGSGTAFDFNDNLDVTISGGVIIIDGQAGGGGGDPVTVSTGTFYTEDVLYEVTITSATGSIIIPGISQNYEHLRLEIFTRSDRAASAADSISLRFNGDTGNNYAKQRSQLTSTDTYVVTDPDSKIEGAFFYPASNAPTGSFGVGQWMIWDYAEAHMKWATLTDVGVRYGTDGTTVGTSVSAGTWLSTAAVTRIDFYHTNGNIVAGSKFRLIGIKKTVLVTAVQGGGSVAGNISAWDDGVFAGSGTIIDFGDNLDVSVSGTVIHVDATGGAGGAAVYATGTSVIASPTILDFDETILIEATGTQAFIGRRAQFCVLYNTSTKTIANQGSVVSWDAVLRGETDWWDSGNPTRLLLPHLGLYAIWGTFRFDSQFTSDYWLFFNVSDATLVSSMDRSDLGNPNYRPGKNTMQFVLSEDPAAYVTMSVGQDVGSSRTMDTGGRFGVAFLGYWW